MPAVAVEPKTFNFNTSRREKGKNLHTTKEYEADPHKTIIDFCASFIDKIQVAPSKIMVATYRRPEKTSGGVIIPGQSLDEDKWQGVAALVLKVGSAAFKDDATTSFFGFEAKVNEWVTFRPAVGVAREFDGLHCRIVEDKLIDAIISDPTLVW